MAELILFVFEDACLHPVIHGKLVADWRPVGNRPAIPLLIQLHNPQVECFAYCILVGESPFFCDFSQARVDRFYGVYRIHHPPDSATIIVKLRNVLPVMRPYIHCSGVFAHTCLKRSKSLSAAFKQGLHTLSLTGQCMPCNLLTVCI